MSSQRPDAKATKWPRWRVSMLAGALILLLGAILDASVDLPRAIYYVLFFGGYVLLAYGFFLAMSARREQREKEEGE